MRPPPITIRARELRAKGLTEQQVHEQLERELLRDYRLDEIAASTVYIMVFIDCERKEQ